MGLVVFCSSVCRCPAGGEERCDLSGKYPNLRTCIVSIFLYDVRSEGEPVRMRHQWTASLAAVLCKIHAAARGWRSLGRF